MKTYNQTEDGAFTINNRRVPNISGNLSYKVMMSEVASKAAEIIPYSEPSDTPEKQIHVLEQSITVRNIRSALLGDQYAINKIQGVENEIIILRSQL